MASRQENQNGESVLDRLVAGKTTLHKNTDREVLLTSEDKMRLQLIEYQNILELRYGWKISLDRSLTLLTTIVAVDKFRDILSIPAAVWEAGFYIGLVISLIGLAKAGIRFFKSRNRSGIDELLDRLKGLDSNLETKESMWFTVKDRFFKDRWKEVSQR